MKNKKIKSTPKAPSINPFEVHINKQKFQVIGQKSKAEHGLPGISKQRAYKKREESLLSEHKLRHKRNNFQDSRIGEEKTHLEMDKKHMMRMAAQQKKFLSKKQKFNLNDEEELTHGGKILTDDLMKDTTTFSDEEPERDELDADFVEEQHFSDRKSNSQSKSNGRTSARLSKKERMEMMISEAKHKKAEATIEKMQVSQAVAQLDSKVQHFFSLMKGNKGTEEDQRKSNDSSAFKDYDSVYKTLKHDCTSRGQPTDRMITEKEAAKRELEKLKRMQRERRERMNGEEEEEESRRVERGADDLTIGKKAKKSPAPQIAYIDGKLVQEVLEDDNSDTVKKGTKNNITHEDEVDSVIESEGEELSNDSHESDESGESDTEDSYSDVLSVISEDGECSSREDKSTNECLITAETVNPENKELPCTFTVSESYNDFLQLLQGRTPSEVATIMERTLATNHPSLGKNNKEHCVRLVAYAVQVLSLLCQKDGTSFHTRYPSVSYINSFIPVIYRLSQFCPQEMAQHVINILDDKFYSYCANPKKFPYADSFVLLKLCSLLFPVTDFRHSVTTRASAFLLCILGQSKVSSERDVVCLLFATGLLLQFFQISNRFCPEVLNALKFLLSLCSSNNESQNANIDFNRRTTKRLTPPLTLVLQKVIDEKRCRKFALCDLNASDDSKLPTSDVFRIQCVNETLRLVSEAHKLWTQLPSGRTIFKDLHKLITKIHCKSYPQSTQELISSLTSTLSVLPPLHKHVCKKYEKPNTIYMLDPLQEIVYEDRRRSGTTTDEGSKEYMLQERRKLQHRLQQERRGAKRELKRDVIFMAAQQLKEVKMSDAERKRKVNLIMQGLSTQESEFNKRKKTK